jgi:hypothetical protein
VDLLRKFLELELAMALWLQPEEEPETAKERADLDAIIALRESAAIELKVCSLISSTARNIVMTFLVRECYGSPKKHKF